MFIFNEDNVCTLAVDLIDRLGLDEDKFVVTCMRYNPETTRVYCDVRKIKGDGETFESLDSYALEVETGHTGGMFAIRDVFNNPWRGDFPIYVATFKPGYELQLVEE